MIPNSISSTVFPDGRTAAAEQRPHAENSAEIEERMTESLMPIVRVALRRGVGVPSLVAWARRTHAELADNRPVPPDQYALEIARMLCSVLLRNAGHHAQSANVAG